MFYLASLNVNYMEKRMLFFINPARKLIYQKNSKTKLVVCLFLERVLYPVFLAFHQ